MIGKVRGETYKYVFVVSLLCFTYIIKSIRYGSVEVSTAVSFLCDFIHIGIFIYWGHSIRDRIIQKQVMRYLCTIDGLIIFWLILKFIKYRGSTGITVERYLWYLYYVPMTAIPLLVLFVAMALRKSENYRTPKWMWSLVLIDMALIIMVLTNDVHNLVFVFHENRRLIGNNEYSYGQGYTVYVGIIVVYCMASLVIMIMKCRISSTKNFLWLPFIPIVLYLEYSMLYVARVEFIDKYFKDMTLVSCILYVATLECCILCGLIQANTGYKEIFSGSSINAIITDDDYNQLLISKNYNNTDKATMASAEDKSIIRSDGVRVCNYKLKNGHIIWLEDVSSLVNIIKSLSELKTELRAENSLLRRNYETEHRIHKLKEQNRLYDIINSQNAKKLELLRNLIIEFEGADDESCKRELLQKMVILGVYLKRRNNLILINEQCGNISARELILSYEESMDNLKLSGVKCGYYINLKENIELETATRLYDFYESVVEHTYPNLQSILVRIFEDKNSIVIAIDAETDVDVSYLTADYKAINCDVEGVTTITLKIPKRQEA